VINKTKQPKLSSSGLRERKKAKTRLEIQRRALRLFREQGYEQTPVTQIAAEAEVSESTFFRYFPTKESVVLWDDFDPGILEAIRSQPKSMSPLRALRVGLQQTLNQLSKDGRAELRERLALMVSVPPLQALLLDEIGGPMQRLGAVLAERAGKKHSDPAVRTLVGAVIGVGLAVMFEVANNPKADIVSLLDDALERLENGLSI
jgi:AcrR family transcriptional regulator